MLSTRYTVFRCSSACIPTISINHALSDILQSTFFYISHTCFVSSAQFLVHASCSERQMCWLLSGYMMWITGFTKFLCSWSNLTQDSKLTLYACIFWRRHSVYLECCPLCSANTPVNFTVLKETQYGLACRWSRTVSLAGSGAGQRGETGDCKPPSCAGDARLEQSHPGPSSYTETHT